MELKSCLVELFGDDLPQKSKLNREFHSDFELIRSLVCQLLTRIGKSISNLRNKQLTSRIRRERIIGEESGHLDNINELNFNRRSWGAEIYSNGIPSGAVENRFVHSSRVYVRYQVGRRNNIVTHYYDLL